MKMAQLEVEGNTRQFNIKQALAIVAHEGQVPGPSVLKVYEDYVSGKINMHQCIEEVQIASLKDLYKQDQKINSDSSLSYE
jgi:hypothetical protein